MLFIYVIWSNLGLTLTFLSERFWQTQNWKVTNSNQAVLCWQLNRRSYHYGKSKIFFCKCFAHFLIRLASSKVDLDVTQGKLDTLGDYDDQILGLKREVRLLTAEKNDMLTRINYLEPLYPLYRDYLPSYIR